MNNTHEFTNCAIDALSIRHLRASGATVCRMNGPGWLYRIVMPASVDVNPDENGIYFTSKKTGDCFWVADLSHGERVVRVQA